MSLTETAYKALRRDILHGVIEPGTRLTEVRLAEQFGISRTPIREALARLKNEGLVTDEGAGGIVVADTSLRDVEEIFGLRSVLEMYAVEETFRQLQEVDILQLEVFVNQAKCYLADDDIEGVLKANTGFHDFILEKSENRRLQQILENLMDAILRYRVATLHTPGTAQQAIERHERLVQALRDRDLSSAQALIQKDVQVAKEVVLSIFRDEDESDVSRSA